VTNINPLHAEENRKNMEIVKKAYMKGEQMLRDMQAFHPVITGVVVLAMVGKHKFKNEL